MALMALAGLATTALSVSSSCSASGGSPRRASSDTTNATRSTSWSIRGIFTATGSGWAADYQAAWQ